MRILRVMLCYWAAVGIVAALVGLSGCAIKTSPIPSQYRDQIDQNITFGMLSRQGEAYRGKVVALGGVIVNARQDRQGRTWMFVRNRPLDIDLEPHIPVSRDEQDAFWAIADAKQLPTNLKLWARVTVVGRVSDESPAELGLEWKKGKQPVMAALYVHGWEGLGSYSPAFKNAVDDAKGSRGQLGSPSNLKKN
jgi:starvation-inducible outer membrane lipoprotein